jgi:hypothetical protein
MWSEMTKISVILMVTLFLCLGAARADDTQSLKDFAQRVATNNYAEADLTFGALPPNWAAPAPLPEGLTVLGSVTSKTYHTVTIYYRVQNLKQTYDAYISALRSAGFHSNDLMPRAGGFVLSNSTLPTNTMVCRGRVNVAIQLSATRADDLRVSLPQTVNDGMCVNRMPTMENVGSPLPNFMPLPGTKVVPINVDRSMAWSSSNGMSAVNSAAQISGKVTAKQILESLESQLRAAHWQVSQNLSTPTSGLATLSFGSGPKSWHGLVSVYQANQRQTYVARVEASGGVLEPQQIVALVPHLPKIVTPIKKSDESDLAGLLQLMAAGSSNSGEVSEVYLRKLPPEFPKNVVLPQQQVAGAIVAKNGSAPTPGAATSYSLYYKMTPSNLQAYYDLLKQRGWENQTYPLQRLGGFTPSDVPGLVGFCKDNLPILQLMTLPGNQSVSIQVSPVGCDTMRQMMSAPLAMEPRAPLPELTAPAGVTMLASGGAGVPGGSSGAAFRSPLSLPQLMDEFTAQMQQAGWQAGAYSVGSAVGTRSYTITDSKAKQWQATITLYAAANEPGTYYAFVDATDLTSHGRDFAGEPR